MTPIISTSLPGGLSPTLSFKGKGAIGGEEDGEEVVVTRLLTPMEKTEFEKGVFGGEPLDVGDGGVAVMEEAVGGHWADVVF